MAKIINLTPHAITFVNDEGEARLTVEPSGTVARLKAETVQTGEVDGIPVTETRYGAIEGLPAPSVVPADAGAAESEMTIYIVSSLVAAQCGDRKDVFIPNESVRDDQGRIIGCKSLGRI